MAKKKPDRPHTRSLGMRKLFCPVCGEGQIQFSQKCRCQHCKRMVNMCAYLPNVQEIAAKCEEIQAGWKDWERELRTNYPYRPVYVDDVTYHVAGHKGQAYSTICCKD